MAEYSLGTAHGEIDIDADTSGIQKANYELREFDRNVRVSARSSTIASTMIQALAVKYSLLGAGLVALGAIAYQASGAIGLIPAAGVAAGLALGTAAVGAQNFIAAVKDWDNPAKFAEAVAKMGPAAREATMAIRNLGPAWTEMQGRVEESLFQNLAGTIQRLASAYLPMLGNSMERVAGLMNNAIQGIASEFLTMQRQADMSLMLNKAEEIIGHLLGAMRPLVQVFLDLGAVGAPILAELTSHVTPLAEKFAAFISEARKTGELETWMRTGIQAFRDVWNIVSLLFGTIVDLVAILGGPQTLLGVLTAVAQALNNVSGFLRENEAWVQPLILAIGALVAGWKIYSAYMAVVTAVSGSALGTMLSAAFTWAGQMLAHIGRVLAHWALLAAQAALHAARVAGAWLLTHGIAAITAVAQTAWYVLQILGHWLLLGTQALLHGARVAGAWLLTHGIAAITAVAQTALYVLQILGQWILLGAQALLHGARVAGAWLLTHGIAALTAVAATALHVATILGSWLLLATQSLLHGAKVAAAWLLTHGVAAATAIAQTALAVGRIIASWVLMSVQLLARAAIAAGAWLIAMGPIGWAIAAIAAAVALVIYYWDEIVAAFRRAGQWCQDLLNNLGAYISYKWNEIIAWFQAIPGRIQGIFSSAGQWLMNAGRALILGFVTGFQAVFGNIWSGLEWIYNNVTSFFSGVGNWLRNAGWNLIMGIYNGIVSAGGWVYNAIRDWASSVVSGIKSFFGISSPSTVFRDEVGKWIGPGLAIGITANADEAIKAAKLLSQGVMDTVHMSVGGSDAFWDTGGLARTTTPPSNEVESHAASQGDEATGQTIIRVEINNPLAERGSDSVTKSLRTLSSMGAFGNG